MAASRRLCVPPVLTGYRWEGKSGKPVAEANLAKLNAQKSSVRVQLPGELARITLRTELPE
jgi:hypothetical protein